MLTAKAVTLIKIESVYGTDPSPAAADAVITSPVSWSVKTADIQRKVVLPYYGALPDIPIGEAVDISFNIEIYGSGVKDTPPKPVSLLMRAAGFSETINAGTSCVYNELTIQDGESVAIYWYNDGILYKALGCIVDSVKFDLKPNGIAMMNVKLSGLWGGTASITDTAVITPTFGSLQIPPVLQNAALAFETGMGISSKLDLDIANKVIMRRDPNAASGIKRFSIIGRDIKGSLDPEMTALATWNPWTSWNAATAAALSFNLGGTTGNKYTFSLPSVNKAVPKIGDAGGIRNYQLAFVSNPTLAGGNNRLTISHV